MLSAVNVETNSRKISDITKKNVFQLYFTQSMKNFDKISAMLISAVGGKL